MKYPIGTKFSTGGKHPRLCVVSDYLTTRNLSGNVVKTEYTATHEFCGQIVAESGLCETTIARGIDRLNGYI